MKKKEKVIAVQNNEDIAVVEKENSEENKAILEQDKKIKDALVSGEITGLTANEMSIVMQPMVANAETGRLAYPTADAAMLVQSLAEKLGTPNK